MGFFYAKNLFLHTLAYEAYMPLDHIGTSVSKRQNIRHFGTGISKRQDITHLSMGVSKRQETIYLGMGVSKKQDTNSSRTSISNIGKLYLDPIHLVDPGST